MIGCGGGEPDADPALEEETVVEVPVMPEFTEIQAEQLQTGAATFRGQMVRVNSVRVMSLVGTKGFWVELPNGNPFLVRTEDDTTVGVDELVDIVGTITAVSESLVADWVASGSISESDKLIVEFATDFVEVEMLMPAERPSP
tara:strand:- start:1695 stop:2123 length:429 start_codon:yes stop_codon:yes gene_type:complete